MTVQLRTVSELFRCKPLGMNGTVFKKEKSVPTLCAQQLFYSNEGKESALTLPNGFPSPPQYGCPERDDLFAIRGPPGEGCPAATSSPVAARTGATAVQVAGSGSGSARKCAKVIGVNAGRGRQLIL